MKTITTVLLLLSILSLNAQNKLSGGIQLEGILSNPQNLSNTSTIENSFGQGIGLYVSYEFLNSFSVNTGINYRFIQYDRFDKNIHSFINDTRPFDGYNYNQHFLVVPINLRKSFFNEKLFVETGIEFNWILNREEKKPNSDMNYKIGLGSKLGKLDYSLNYIWGNERQSDILKRGTDVKFVSYNTQMLQCKVA